MRGPEAVPSTLSIGRAEAPTSFGNTKLSSEQLTPFVKPPLGTSVQRVRTIKAGETTYIDNVLVSVQKQRPKSTPAYGTVARAEGAHAFLAHKLGIGVEIATIESGPGYLGMVKVAEANAIVAAAHLGTPGDSHDRRVVRAMGADDEASSRTAQGMLASDPVGYDAVTALLEEKRSVDGHQINEAITEANERKETVIVTFITAEGKVFNRKQRARNGEVVIHEIQSKPKEQTVFDPHSKRTDFDLAA